VPLNDAQQQALIASELGQTGVAAFTTFVTTVWTLYEDQALIHPRLRYLRAREHAIRYLIGTLQDLIDHEEAGVSEKEHQQIDTLALLLKQTQDEIAGLLGQLQTGRTPKVGLITRAAPIVIADVVPLPIEPNDRGYRGDPLRRLG
jgi:hypothetical protein